MFSITRLCNFNHTRRNVRDLKERAFGYDSDFANAMNVTETPIEQTHLRSKQQAKACYYIPTIVIGGIVGLSCEATGAIVDCTCNTLTLGNFNMQETQSGYCDEEGYNGSGVLQGCLGEWGNTLGDCIGNIVGSPLYVATYATTLPINCCYYYCCSKSSEQTPLLRDAPTQQRMV